MLARLSYRLPAARLRCTLPTATYSTESINYCRNLVRDKDYDAYLSCLLFPEPQRDACFSILAFNQEMQSIRHQSNNNAMAGRMRFQWWRSLIDDIYIHAKGESGGNRTGKALSQHPVVEVLSDSVQKYNLTQRWLERLLEARQSGLDFQRPESMSEMEDIAEGSHSPVLYLQNELLGLEGDDAAYAASHFGVCKGIVSMLRASRSTEYEDPGFAFPSEVMSKHGLDIHTLDRSFEENSGPLVDTVHDIASQAFAHLEKGKALQQKSSTPIYSFLGAVSDTMYLQSLKDHNFDVNAANMATAAHTFTVKKQMRLLYSKWKGSV